MIERTFQWLNELPAERHSISHKFQDLGFSITNAFMSQGTLELKQAYCDKKLCLQCTIGKKLLAFNGLPKPFSS
jgi:hypothetical protein